MLCSRTPLIFWIALFVVSACSTTPKHTHDAPLLPGMKANGSVSDSINSTEVTPAAELPQDALIIEKAETAPEEEGEDALDDVATDLEPVAPKGKKQIPFEFNQKVADWIQYFSQKDRERFQRFLDRGEPYREVIQNILEENQVPADLYYLGMIESGFSTHAQSHAKAVGVWQFMRATGKLYGLHTDQYVDQRRDPIRATEAAAKMLRDLYREFHSWYLAMAAYNAGPGRIRGAIRRAKTSDFWELVEKKKLPRETMEYVPKFLAARYIGENPDLFAFYINEEKKYPNVELVKVPSPIQFESIEKACSMPQGTLAFVNPQYLKSYTHPGHTPDEIWVPESFQKSVEGKSVELASMTMKVRAIRERPGALPREKQQIYIVKKGDSLKNIARRRGLSVAYLKRVNGLRGGKISVGQRLSLSASSYHEKRTHPRKHKKKRSK